MIWTHVCIPNLLPSECKTLRPEGRQKKIIFSMIENLYRNFLLSIKLSHVREVHRFAHV